MPTLPGNLGKNSKAQKLEANAIVEYEHSGKPLLGILVGEKKNKWVIFSERNREVELPAARVYLLPGGPSELPTAASERAELLAQYVEQAKLDSLEINLEELWEIVSGDITEADTKELTELFFGDNTFKHHLAMRRALLDDSVFFKRRKTGFEPRAAEAVEQMQIQRRVEKEKEEARENLIESLVASLKDPTLGPPSQLEPIEQLATLGTHAENHRTTHEIVEAAFERSGIVPKGKVEDRAFNLLVRIGHFSPHENLALYRFKRPTSFSESLITEAKATTEAYPGKISDQCEDLRSTYMVSIDGDDTMDIDDAISIEELEHGYKIGVHITDVASFIDRDTLLDQEARLRATTIYCPTFRIPMLPTLLSEGTLSLVAGKDRQALSYFITIDKDFTVTDRQITRSLICVNHRLTYEQVDTLLCSEAGAESISEEADTMLPILCSISSSLEEIRIQRGAVSFNRREMLPVISDDFSISLEESFDDSPSRKLVGELMILTNETVALFAKNNLIPLIFRGQEPPDENIPEVTEAVPDGPAREYYVRSLMKRSVTSTKPLPHFGLGLLAYAHCTSPIRRVADLINQRQILSFIKNGSPELDESEVVNLSGEIEHGSQEASYIQREGNRYWLLQYLKQEKTSHLWGTIVKTQGKKPLAEIDGIFSLLPFKPQASSSSDDINKRKGERIYMRIVRLEPLRDTIILEETKAPNAG